MPSTVAYDVPAGTVGQQAFGGPLGMDFDVNQAVVVTRLGVFDSSADGLATALTARLYDRDTQAQVASLSFPAGQTGQLVDGSRFLPLPTPVVLPAGFHGSIVAEGYNPSEPNGNGFFQNITWTTNDGGGQISFVGGGRFGFTPGAFPTSQDGGPANRYAAGTFDFMPFSQIATGPAAAVAGTPYTLNLNLPQASISSWAVSWGDGSSSTLAGNPSQASHVYTSGGNFAVAVTANTAQGALGTSYRDVVLSDAPAAYWRLGETSLAQPVAHDEVGGHDATYQNFSAADLGQPGALSNDASTSVRFNGVNEYVSLPDVFNFPTAGSTTQYAAGFGAWFKTTTAGVILGQMDTSGVPGGAAPGGYVPALYVGTDGHVYANLFWNGTGPTLTSASAYNDGSWHQAVVVFDHGLETLYLDGKAVAQQAAEAVGYAPAYSYTLGVGYTTFWPGTPGGWLYFNGQLDEVAVYNGAPTEQQVAAQYLAGTASRVAVAVQNAKPTAFLQGPTDGVRGQPRPFTFSATSGSAAEQAAGFTYTINWGDNSPVQTVAHTPGNASGVSLSHIFTDSGTYTVTVTATDQDGHASDPVSQVLTISTWAVQTQPDPLHPGQTVQVLVVGGSTGADAIFVTQASTGLQVFLFEASGPTLLQQVFSGPIGRIQIFGQDGNDLIAVSHAVTLPAELYGGPGNDILIGGGGSNLLVGGSGFDILIGNPGDTVVASASHALVATGSNTPGSRKVHEAAVKAVLHEWLPEVRSHSQLGRLLGSVLGRLHEADHHHHHHGHHHGGPEWW